MRIKSYFFLLFCLFSCTSEQVDKQKQNDSGPNIIYILADDLGYGDLNVYNPNSKIPTPNLDQMAADGMLFTDAHSPSSVCTPTRYSILTGEYPWRSRLKKGVLWSYGRSLIEKGQNTVASILKSHGYTNGVVGKWHLGLDWAIKPGHDSLMYEGADVNDFGLVKNMAPQHIDFTQKPTDGPLDHGFDYSFILTASLDIPPYCYLQNDVLTELPTDSTIGNDLNTGYTGAFWRPGKMAPSFEFDQVLPTFSNKAIDFIQEQAKTEDPFFLYLPLAAPHTPWVPTNDYNKKSAAGSYGDFVNMVDHEVGRVLQSLDELGLSENTLVIFTSDNGPYWKPDMIEKHGHKAAGNLRGMKADIWEGGHRVPFIVRWPGKIEAGTKSNALTTLANLMDTVVDILGINFEIKSGQDSYSILPNLLGNTDEGQGDAIHHSSRGHFAIRKGDWKLILQRGSGGFSSPQTYTPSPDEAQGQLYNLREDPQEVNNLYQSSPEIVTELTELLESIKK